MNSPHRELGAFITGTEAKQLADRLDAGDTLTRALVVVGSGRRSSVSGLLANAGLGPNDRSATIGYLRGIEGAHSHPTTITPVWTAPDNLAQHGQLTATVEHFVRAAHESVVCSTFNFQRSSVQWTVLREVATRTEVEVRVYVDGNATAGGFVNTPTCQEIAAELDGATVFRTKPADCVRNHAKFIAVDHQYVIVTSANFSYSAEHRNVELGLLLENPLLTQSIERQMRLMERDVYQLVRP